MVRLGGIHRLGFHGDGERRIQPAPVRAAGQDRQFIRRRVVRIETVAGVVGGESVKQRAVGGGGEPENRRRGLRAVIARQREEDHSGAQVQQRFHTKFQVNHRSAGRQVNGTGLRAIAILSHAQLIGTAGDSEIKVEDSGAGLEDGGRRLRRLHRGANQQLDGCATERAAGRVIVDAPGDTPDARIVRQRRQFQGDRQAGGRIEDHCAREAHEARRGHFQCVGGCRQIGNGERAVQVRGQRRDQLAVVLHRDDSAGDGHARPADRAGQRARRGHGGGKDDIGAPCLPRLQVGIWRRRRGLLRRRMGCGDAVGAGQQFSELITTIGVRRRRHLTRAAHRHCLHRRPDHRGARLHGIAPEDSRVDVAGEEEIRDIPAGVDAAGHDDIFRCRAEVTVGHHHQAVIRLGANAANEVAPLRVGAAGAYRRQAFNRRRAGDGRHFVDRDQRARQRLHVIEPRYRAGDGAVLQPFHGIQREGVGGILGDMLVAKTPEDHPTAIGERIFRG
ncbi:MAG: hypothetical protein BWY76_02279 [bacterium ADurb.Bin429]|nr:MAG: hypothetical protein BWY76_02279 [bacterium ADurb.Bin429]